MQRAKKSVKTQAIEGWKVLAGSSQLSIPRSETCALHMIEMQRVGTVIPGKKKN